MQVCNVVMGGNLYRPARPTAQVNNHNLPDILEAHQVSITEQSLLHRVTGATNACDQPASPGGQAAGPWPKATAVSEEGIIEAIGFEDGRPALCVQWHPENLAGTDKRHQALFDWLVQAAKDRK